MTVQVREWDPAAAPADEIESVLRTLNVIIATDVPEDPPWRDDSFREYLSVTMPDEQRFSWVATEGAEAVGYASILLVGGIAVLELYVTPAARCGGMGCELLRAAAKRVESEGFTSIGVEVIGGTPAAGFYEGLGFRCAFIEMRSMLDLSTMDWPRLAELAGGIGSGYRIGYHPGGPP